MVNCLKIAVNKLKEKRNKYLNEVYMETFYKDRLENSVKSRLDQSFYGVNKTSVEMSDLPITIQNKV